MIYRFNYSSEFGKSISVNEVNTFAKEFLLIHKFSILPNQFSMSPLGHSNIASGRDSGKLPHTSGDTFNFEGPSLDDEARDAQEKGRGMLTKEFDVIVKKKDKVRKIRDPNDTNKTPPMKTDQIAYIREKPPEDLGKPRISVIVIGHVDAGSKSVICSLPISTFLYWLILIIFY